MSRLWLFEKIRGPAPQRRRALYAENLVRIDLVTESLNVGCDGRAIVLPFETIGLAVQID